MGSFWSMCPETLIKVISERHDLETCVFGHWKGLAGLKLWQVLMHTKLPIISFLQKLIIIFCCLIFKESEKKFLNQEFYGQLLEHAWSKGSFDFSKFCPSGHQVFFQIVSKWKEVFVRMDWLLTMITNSFKILITKNLETFFLSFFLHWLYDHDIYFLFSKYQQNS